MEEITESQFDEIIINKDLVVIDFYATWCMPCRMLKPIMERVEGKLTDVKFYTLDATDAEEVSKRYRIFSVPTIIAFKEGKKVDSLVGLKTYDEIVDFVNRCKTTNIEE